MSDYYIVSLKHTPRRDRYITFWRPDNRGYAWALSWAGKYSRDTVMAHLGYYNTGWGDIAVPCEVVDPLAVEPIKGYIDNDAGPVVPNTKENWRILMAAVIVPPPNKMKPAVIYFGRNSEGYRRAA